MNPQQQIADLIEGQKALDAQLAQRRRPSVDLDALTFEQKAELLAQFEQFDKTLESYALLDWTPNEEIETLIDLVRNAESESTRLNALKQLQARRREVLQNSGLLVQATETRQDEQDGRKTVLSAQVVRMALNFDRKDSTHGQIQNQNSQQKQSQEAPASAERGPGGDTEEARGREAATDNSDPGAVRTALGTHWAPTDDALFRGLAASGPTDPGTGDPGTGDPGTGD